jgi:copper(I)-binding protein
MRFPLFAVTVTAVALSATAPAALAAKTAIEVTGAWSRAVPAGLPTGAVYLTVANLGHEPDRLVSAETPVAARMALHRSIMANGMMSMVAVPGGLDIPAGGVL